MNRSTSSELHRSGCTFHDLSGFQQAFRRFLSRGVENPVHNCPRNLSAVTTNPMIARHGPLMPRRRHAENQNLLFFPELEVTTTEHATHGGVGELIPKLTSTKSAVLADFAKSPGGNCDVVISGAIARTLKVFAMRLRSSAT